MKTLGNHPKIDNPVSLALRFDDFKNTIVINGDYCFNDIVRYLQRGEYLPSSLSYIKIHAINPYQPPYTISLSDPIMSKNLIEFKNSLPNSVTIIEIA